MPRAFVSVIVPHYEDLENLAKCLGALVKQTYPRESFEIVVADNGSSIGEAALHRAIDGRARLVNVEPKGAGPARNGGVAASKGEILAFTDSDCVPSPQWLAEGVSALDRYDFVGGRVDVSVADENRVTPTEAFEKVFAFDFKTYIKRKGFTGSGNLFVSRRVFDAVGGFGGDVSEDVDWSRRAADLGFHLGYAPQAVVTHRARHSWAELRAKWRRVNREMYALQVRARHGRIRWLLRSLLLPASVLAHSPRVLTSPKLHGPQQRIGALAILVRSRLWRFIDAMKIGTVS